MYKLNKKDNTFTLLSDNIKLKDLSSCVSIKNVKEITTDIYQFEGTRDDNFVHDELRALHISNGLSSVKYSFKTLKEEMEKIIKEIF